MTVEKSGLEKREKQTGATGSCSGMKIDSLLKAAVYPTRKPERVFPALRVPGNRLLCPVSALAVRSIE